MAKASTANRAAIDAANLIYDGQAIVRICAAVIDEDNDVPQFSRHTVWRALQAADRIFEQVAEQVSEMEVRRGKA